MDVSVQMRKNFRKKGPGPLIINLLSRILKKIDYSIKMSNPTQTSGALGSKNSEPTCFKKGDVVWAKVRGYSWWPAKISEVQRASERERKYKVDFIGDNTH